MDAVEVGAAGAEVGAGDIPLPRERRAPSVPPRMGTISGSTPTARMAAQALSMSSMWGKQLFLHIIVAVLQLQMEEPSPQTPLR